MENLEFKIQKIQVALFSDDFNLKDSIKTASELQEKSGGFLNGKPTVIPLPEDAPEEIPSIFLQSEDGIFQCTVGRKRIDFTEQYEELTKTINELFEDFVKKANVFVEYANSASIKITRVGFVIDFVAEAEKNSASFLIDKVFSGNKSIKAKGSSGKIKVASTSIVEEATISNLEVNKRISFDSGLRKMGEDNDRYLSVRYDVNTLAEKANEYNLQKEDIESLMRNVYDEVKDQKVGIFFKD